MSWFLRTVKAPKWYKLPDWVPHGQVDADKVWDLKASENKLSIWHVADQSKIPDVAIAVGSNRQHLENLDYILVDETDLLTTGVTVSLIEGTTPYKKARVLHRDIVELSSSQLCALALTFYEKGKKAGFDRHEITELLTKAFREGELDESLNDDIKKKILEALKK